MSNHSCPISSQVEDINESITRLTLRIRSLEDALDFPELPDDKRRQIETELKEITKLMETNKELLKGLHKHNRQSFMVAACLIFVCFFVYGVYLILTNQNNY